MSSDPMRHFWFTLVALVVALPMGGCVRHIAALQLTSYREPHAPRTYELNLDDCAYYVGSGGDYHIVGRAIDTPENGVGATIEQLLHVHLFWKPWPGKTFANSSMMDATIRYAIVTETGTAVYTGTGFVYPRKQGPRNGIVADIEAANLRLNHVTGNAPELLGSTRLSGTLVAQDDASLAVDIRRRLDLQIGTAGID
jgi:hypothetical protein